MDSDDEHSLWSRPFSFGSINIRVEEEWGLGIGGTVWEGGVLLARYLSSAEFYSARFTESSTCLEIGAGITALPSIAVAHICTFGQVVVTDIDECMEALAANLAANLPVNCRLTYQGNLRPEETREAASREGWEIPQTVLDLAAQDIPLNLNLDKSYTEPTASPADDERAQCQDEVTSSEQWHESGTAGTCYSGQEAPLAAPLKTPSQQGTYGTTEVVVQSLDWRNGLQNLELPFDLLLVADVVYVVELMEPLVRCMSALAAPTTEVILAYYERSRAASEIFWELLPQYFSFEKIPEASYGVSPQPADVGLFKLRKL